VGFTLSSRTQLKPRIPKLVLEERHVQEPLHTVHGKARDPQHLGTTPDQLYGAEFIEAVCTAV
jgi:hypothetical protein